MTHLHAQTNSTLWYDKPATKWASEALPLGNGRIGCMVFGGLSERIQFNDSSLWTGDTNPTGDYRSPSMGMYQNFGELQINCAESPVQNYRRELSLAQAAHRVTFSSGGVNHTRTVIASRPDECIAFQWTADKPGAISAKIKLVGAHDEVTRRTDGTIFLSGELPNGMLYEARAKVIVTGGTVTSGAEEIEVVGCDSVRIILVAGTNYTFDSTKKYFGPSPHDRLEKQLTAAAEKSFEAIQAAQVKDHQSLYNRVSVDWGASSDDVRNLPTDERIERMKKKGEDPELEQVLFNLGRYLLIGCSRQPALPANLQGLWNDSNKAAWGSDYHANINVQMNYWGAEVGNLSECQLPLFDLIQSQVPDWRKATAADKEFQLDGKPVRGWALRTSHNITGGMGWKWDKTANAWYCSHMWEHYDFSRDREFLKNVALPTMKETCQFWEDQLKTLDDGRLVIPQGWSPEHGPHEDGVSYNQQIVWNLFDKFVRTCDELQVEKEYRDKIAAMKEKLVGPQIGKWGQLQEWMTDQDNPKDEHRHTSHLFAVYPGNQISILTTPELAQAAQKSLESRGTAGDSRRQWVWVWRGALWARFHEGDKAHAMIHHLFEFNTLHNLFGVHPPMQLDSNFGIVGTIGEMLVQSHELKGSLPVVSLLPALPTAWKNGKVTGLMARGGVECSFEWTDGKLKHVTFSSIRGSEFFHKSNGQLNKISLKPGESRTIAIP